MPAPVLLACDWGTTVLRAWTLDGGGAVVGRQTFPLGVGRLAPGEAARRFGQEVRPALNAETLPAILCGMVGSALGWQATAYVDCPASLQDLAGRLQTVAPGVRIVPGLRCEGLTGAPDVMRGEETQVFGWLAAQSDPSDGRRLICHPGTHAKWVVIDQGRIARFVTAMTGELFAVLGAHSVLRPPDGVVGDPDDRDAFEAGLAAAGSGDALAARLFSVRSRVVGGGAPPESSPSYLSGLLIGAEVASLPSLLEGADGPVILLGDAALCERYGRAFEQRGVDAVWFDGEAAAIAGLFSLGTAR